MIAPLRCSAKHRPGHDLAAELLVGMLSREIAGGPERLKGLDMSSPLDGHSPIPHTVSTAS